ncbi:MAG TPA: flavin reductase family protein [Deltaproteobacteria bacterium]|nr:flavin reductase family protein [Deltaproteobacteria bacterium]
MPLSSIPVDSFLINAHALWSKRWFVLACGDFAKGSYNAMTVGWGSFGIMWNKPFAQVVVRPTRYTFEFMERYDSFTLCAFPQRFRKALEILGSRSGRNCDKVAESGLTPVASRQVASPSFAEADLLIELTKIFSCDFDPERFLDASIEKHYPLKDYHRSYFGEVLAIRGTESYR